MGRRTIISAVPSAFDADGRLDLRALRCVAHVLEGDVDLVLVNGTTGEFPSLTHGERLSQIEVALARAGEARVIAHVGASSSYEAVGLAHAAIAAGATKIAAITPFFLPASREAVRRYFNDVRQAAPDAELYAYLFPDRTHVDVNVEDAAALVREFALSGVKLSILGVDYLQRLVGLCPGVAIYSGNDRLVAEVDEAGGAGVVSGVSSAVPGIVSRVAHLLHRGPSVLETPTHFLHTAVDLLGPNIAALKTALVLQGVMASDRCRMALDPVTIAQKQQIVRLLQASQPNGAAAIAQISDSSSLH